MERMESSGSVLSPEEVEEGGNPALETAAGGGAGTGDAGGASPVVAATSTGGTAVAGGEGEAEGKEELWWRYEPLGAGVVKDRTPSGGSALAGAEAKAEGCNGSVGAAAGIASSVNGDGGSRENGAEVVTVRVNCPIRVLDHKHGVYECHPLGKEAQTVGGWVVLCVSGSAGMIVRERAVGFGAAAAASVERSSLLVRPITHHPVLAALAVSPPATA